MRSNHPGNSFRKGFAVHFVLLFLNIMAEHPRGSAVSACKCLVGNLLFYAVAAKCMNSPGSGYASTPLFRTAGDQQFVPWSQNDLFSIYVGGIFSTDTNHIFIKRVGVLLRNPVSMALPKCHLCFIRTLEIISLNVSGVLLRSANLIYGVFHEFRKGLHLEYPYDNKTQPWVQGQSSSPQVSGI